jgi:hypothetical protein
MFLDVKNLVIFAALALAASASAQMMPAMPTLPQLKPIAPNSGPYLASPSGSYLGDFSSQFSPNSIYNQFGTYGSPYSPNSVNNPFGTYGSPFSPNSATNPYAVTPPRVVLPGIGSYPYSVNPFAR